MMDMMIKMVEQMMVTLLRLRYENATLNLRWVFCAMLGVLCN